MTEILEMLPPVVADLLNAPDLILLAIILVSACLGASRGLMRTLMNALGRLIALIGAAALARLAAPVMARFLVTPIVGEIFEIRALDFLSRMPDASDAFQTKATEIAATMTESLSFFLLFILFLFAMNAVVHLIATTFKLVTHIGPIGFLDSVGGFALGAVFGLVLCALGLAALTIFSPSTFTELGILSPERVEDTRIMAFLLGLLPTL